MSVSAASVWPHFCLSQWRRPAHDVVADSPSSEIKSSSCAGVIHPVPVAATQVYWPKDLSPIAFRRGKLSRQAEDLALGSRQFVSICPDYHGDLLLAFSQCIANPARHPERFASTRQWPVSNTGPPFHSHLARHCHRSKACHCKSPRYLSSSCSCRQFPSLMLHHL